MSDDPFAGFLAEVEQLRRQYEQQAEAKRAEDARKVAALAAVNAARQLVYDARNGVPIVDRITPSEVALLTALWNSPANRYVLLDRVDVEATFRRVEDLNRTLPHRLDLPPGVEVWRPAIRAALERVQAAAGLRRRIREPLRLSEMLSVGEPGRLVLIYVIDIVAMVCEVDSGEQIELQDVATESLAEFSRFLANSDLPPPLATHAAPTELEPAASATTPAEPSSEKPKGRRGRPKKGDTPSTVKVLAALVFHHAYDNGRVTNPCAATRRTMVALGLPNNALSLFLKRKLGNNGSALYKTACEQKRIGKLLAEWYEEVPDHRPGLTARETGYRDD